jgi:hypothetical protein
MATGYLECELWVTVDDAGDYAVSKESAESAVESFNSDIGGSNPTRTVRVVVRVPALFVPSVSVDAPEMQPADASAE